MNPIIRREFLGTLRTGRALAVMVILVVVLAALVLVRWPSNGVNSFVGLQGMQAQQVLRVFGYGLMVALMLLTPVFPATSVVREKQSGTLALLLNSPMSASAIVLGKLVGSLGFIAILIILSVPAAGACFAMGGIGTGQLGSMYLVLAMLTLLYTALGLLMSSYAQTTESALRLTYGMVLLLGVVTLAPYQFVGGAAWLGPIAAQAIDWLRNVSPIPAMKTIMGDSAIGGGLLTAGDPVIRFTILAAVLSVAMTLWTIYRLNQRVLDRARDAGTITDERSAGARIYRRIMYLWFFDPQRRSGLIGRFTNPVMVKEQRCRRFGRGHWMMRMIGGCLIISLALMLLAARGTIAKGVEALGGIMVLLQVALVILITPSLAGGLIAGERESGGWQLLQMTPLSALTIITGKLMSVLWTLVLLLAATLPAYVVLILIQPAQKAVVAQVLLTLVLTAALALLLSAAASSVMRHTAAATAAAYAILVALCAGTLLIWLAQDAPFTRSTVQTVLTVNPLAAALSLIAAPGFAHYQLVPAGWWIVGGMCIACLIVLAVQTWRLTRPR